MTSPNTLYDNLASEAREQLQSRATPAIEEGKQQAGAFLEQSGEMLEMVRSRVGESAAELSERLIAYTKKNPLIALLLAVGIGALLVGVAKPMRSR